MTTWSRYMDGQVGRWAFRHERLVLPNGRTMGQALEDDPWQREIWDIVDDPSVEVAMLLGFRGIGKTSFVAALGSERIVLRRRHEVIAVANDLDQVRLLLEEAAGFVRRDPMLSKVCSIFRDRIENRQTGSRLRVVTADAVSSYGLGARPTTYLYDELWGATNRDLLDALLSALPKSPGSQFIAPTNAGFVDTPAHELWQLCRAPENPSFVGWDSVERGVWPSWLPRDALEQQRKLLPKSQVDRLWFNVWTAGGGEYLAREDVLACVDDSLDPHSQKFVANRRYYGGVDLGVRHDRSVIAIGHKEREVFVCDHIATWFGTQECPVSLEAVQAHLHMLAGKIPRLRRVYVDPWQALLLIERAKRAGVRNVEEYTFTSQNLQLLSQSVWQAFRSGNIRVPRYEPLLDELVSAKVRESRYHWRVDHEAGGYTDHLTALGLALVAAIPERGELIFESPSDQHLIEFFRERVSSPHRFGFAKRSGRMSVGAGPSRPDLAAEVRLCQLLHKADRISPEEVAMLREEIRRRAFDDPWMQWRSQYTDGLEAELGTVFDFVYDNQSAEEGAEGGVR